MKKVIIVAAALLISFNSFAKFGIIAGLTSSSTNIKSAYADLESKSIALYHVGVTAKFDLGGVFAIQPSLIYNVKGAKLAEFDLGTIDFKTGFIELPVQIQAGVPIGSLLRIYGIAEPFIGYAVSNKIEGIDLGEKWYVVSNKIEGIDLGDKWKNVSNKFEYGVGLGAGVELFSHLQVSVRYFWNLGNVYDFSWKTVSNAPNGKCNGITASLAFLF